MSDEKGHIVRRTGYLVATGSLVEGFDLYGTFETQEYAEAWAENHLMHDDWHVLPSKIVRDHG